VAGSSGAGYLVALGLVAVAALHMHDAAGRDRSADAPEGRVLPAAEPLRVEIPRIGVRAPVRGVGRNHDGTLQVPPLSRPQEVGWYRHGPPPGSRGAAVLVGHYDDLRGPAVFHRLGELRRGDVVRVVRRDGRVAVFTVDASEQVAKSAFPTHRVYGPVRHAGLRLITCGGTFDRARRSYRDNLIVYARLTDARPAA